MPMPCMSGNVMLGEKKERKKELKKKAGVTCMGNRFGTSPKNPITISSF